jgi:hypothetical protein
MSLSTSISTGLTSLNSTVTSNLIDYLTPLVTSGELATISANLSTFASPTDISSLSTQVTSYQSILNSKMETVASAYTALNKDTTEVAATNPNQVVQDNTKSYKFAEMPILSNKTVTDMTNFPPASNNLSDDYPNTIGAIDEAHNWYKINKTTGYIEFVHNSGSSIKIDKSGNTSIHITGNLKFSIDKEMVLNILSNADIHAIGNMSIEGSTLQFN